MRYRTFGRIGWKVSEIGFGAWAIGGDSWGHQDDDESLAALRQALDLGVTFIDTAQVYGNGHSEQLIARVLKERGQRGGGGPIRVPTKIPPVPGVWPPLPDDVCAERYPGDYLRQRVEQSLRDLDAEVLDLVQLHTWTRAWNRDPVALETLQQLKQEGKILAIGISTPEHDQNSLNELMRADLLDSVQVIYNIFEQEPAAEFLHFAQEHNVGVIVRVVFDEGALTGKFTSEAAFAEGDFRRVYFKGDRLAETVRRVEEVRTTIQASQDELKDMPSVAIRFALKHPAVSVVIPGMRTVKQAELNCATSDQEPLSDALHHALKAHIWRRADWYPD